MAGKRNAPPGAVEVSDDYRFNDALARIDWKEFERVMARWFTYQGFQVAHRGTGQGRSIVDGGVDLVLEKSGRRIIVDCKHHKVYQVPYNPVAQLAGLRTEEKAQGCIVINSGQFKDAAKKTADANGVELIDGKKLRSMIAPHLSWLLDKTQPIPPASDAEVHPTMPILRQAPSVEGAPVSITRPDAYREVRGNSITSRPVAPLTSRRGVWLALAACTMLAAAVALIVTIRPSTTVVSKTPAPENKPVESPQVAPPKAGIASAKASKPDVARPAPDPVHVAPRKPRDSMQAKPAPLAEEIVYKSADMSDEEFAAWKARKAERAHGPAAQAVEAPPVDKRVDEPSHETPEGTGESPTSPETMRTILRTNRR